jgi:hypothetical protein
MDLFNGKECKYDIDSFLACFVKEMNFESLSSSKSMVGIDY